MSMPSFVVVEGHVIDDMEPKLRTAEINKGICAFNNYLVIIWCVVNCDHGY